MLISAYRRWCLRRLRSTYEDKNCRQEALSSLYHMGRSIVFDKVPYPIRIKYRVFTKTQHLGELLSLIKVIQQYIHHKKDYIDQLPAVSVDRQWTNVDRWMVDKDALPYDEVSAIELLLDSTVSLLDQMSKLKSEHVARYSYINDSIQFLYIELIGVLDSLIAMQLSMPYNEELEEQIKAYR